MGLNRSKGNMYDWVSHTWTPIIGCPHQCSYCYVRSFHGMPAQVSESPSSWPALGKGKTIFVGHLCDLFAEGVDAKLIVKVLDWCGKFLENDYVFQSKNPERMREMISFMPLRRMLGTTIETNRADVLQRLSKAPPPLSRASSLRLAWPEQTFLTVEPVMDFDLDQMVELCVLARPRFVNVGADSKGNGLPEPSAAKVRELIERLGDAGLVVKKKFNLERLTDGAAQRAD